jgi:hypothetical protein
MEAELAALRARVEALEAWKVEMMSKAQLSLVVPTNDGEISKALQLVMEYNASRWISCKDREYTDYPWYIFSAYDWEQKGKGLCVDAERSVKVGCGTYTIHEDPAEAQFLMIQHLNTHKTGKEGHGWSAKARPVFAVDFSAEKVRELQKLLAHQPEAARLIHREPKGEPDPNAAWFSESYWYVEEGKITGVRVVTKMSQDPHPVERLARFTLRADEFDAGDKPEEETLVPESVPVQLYTDTDINLPAPSFTGERLVHIPVEAPDPASLLCEWGGDSECPALNSSTCEGRALANTTSRLDDSGNLICCISTPAIKINNDTQSRVEVRSFSMEYKLIHRAAPLDPAYTPEALLASEGWVEAEGGCDHGDTYEGGRDARWHQESRSFHIPKEDTVFKAFRGRLKRPAEEAVENQYGAYDANELCNRRVHHAFLPDTEGARLLIRLKLYDAEGKARVLLLEMANPAMEDCWSTYEGAVAELEAAKSERDGFGAGFQVDMWMCVENPFTRTKSMVCVTSKKCEEGECTDKWFVRASTSRRDADNNNSYIRPSDLVRQGYQAAKNGEAEVELYGSTGCRVVGLVDLERKCIYAFRGEITIKAPGSEGAVVVSETAHMLLDYQHVSLDAVVVQQW